MNSIIQETAETQTLPPILTTASSNSHNLMLSFHFCSSALSLVARLRWRSTVGSTLAVGIASCRWLWLLCSRETWRWKATLLRVIVLRIALWLSWLRWVAWSVTGRWCATLLRPRGISEINQIPDIKWCHDTLEHYCQKSLQCKYEIRTSKWTKWNLAMSTQPGTRHTTSQST